MFIRNILLINSLFYQLYFAYGVNPKFDAIEKRLSTNEITKTVPMRDFLKQNHQIAEFDSSSVLYVELKDGLKAVFRPFEGEDRNREGEIFAYRFSQWLGLDIVPPVVFRTVNGKEGILRRYVSPSIDLNKKDTYPKALSSIAPQEQANINTFFFVVGQWDTGPHNMLLHKKKSGKWCPWLFDFETVANSQNVCYGEFPFVKVSYIEEEGSAEFDFAGKTFDPQKDKESPLFQKYLNSSGIKKALLRTDLKKSYSVWNNGFYIQYHRYQSAEENLYKPNFTETYDPKVIEKLKTFDLKFLDSLLIDLKANFFNRKDWRNKDVSVWKADLLYRKDQLLQHTKTKGKFFG